MQKLIDAQDEYIALLTKSEASLMSLAFSHGFRFAPELIKRGEELRAEIAELKALNQQSVVKDQGGSGDPVWPGNLAGDD